MVEDMVQGRCSWGELLKPVIGMNDEHAGLQRELLNDGAVYEEAGGAAGTGIHHSGMPSSMSYQVESALDQPRYT